MILKVDVVTGLLLVPLVLNGQEKDYLVANWKHSSPAQSVSQQLAW